MSMEKFRSVFMTVALLNLLRYTCAIEVETYDKDSTLTTTSATQLLSHNASSNDVTTTTTDATSDAQILTPPPRQRRLIPGVYIGNPGTNHVQSNGNNVHFTLFSDDNKIPGGFTPIIRNNNDHRNVDIYNLPHQNYHYQLNSIRTNAFKYEPLRGSNQGSSQTTQLNPVPRQKYRRPVAYIPVQQSDQKIFYNVPNKGGNTINTYTPNVVDIGYKTYGANHNQRNHFKYQKEKVKPFQPQYVLVKNPTSSTTTVEYPRPNTGSNPYRFEHVSQNPVVQVPASRGPEEGLRVFNVPISQVSISQVPVSHVPDVHHSPQVQLYKANVFNLNSEHHPKTLTNLLKVLQSTNRLPQTFTPDNIDHSLNTLVNILNALKDEQPETDTTTQPYGSNPSTYPPNPVLQVAVNKPNVIPHDHESIDELLNVDAPTDELAQLQDEDEDVPASVHSPTTPSSLGSIPPPETPWDSPEDDNDNYLTQVFPGTPEEGGTPGRPGVDYPILDTIPKTAFNCREQRYKGFFGDPETRCQVWHYCDLNGGQASFLCPNGTIFSQVALTCDWWHNVKCASTTQLYVLNERLYKYILPFTPKFPEDYSGPLVDKYLTLKFKELEDKMKKQKGKKEKNTSEEDMDDSGTDAPVSELSSDVASLANDLLANDHGDIDYTTRESQE